MSFSGLQSEYCVFGFSIPILVLAVRPLDPVDLRVNTLLVRRSKFLDVINLFRRVFIISQGSTVEADHSGWKRLGPAVTFYYLVLSPKRTGGVTASRDGKAAPNPESHFCVLGREGRTIPLFRRPLVIWIPRQYQYYCSVTLTAVSRHLFRMYSIGGFLNIC